jgi:hypothetical protein
MNIRRPLAMVLPIAGLAICSGFASIISGRHADVKLSSNAPNTHVVVRDKRGQEVASVEAPAVVSLKRKDRFIWPGRYTATFESQGYTPVVVPINPTINPWIAGNIVAGGVIGLAVDNVTGAAWQPKQDELYAQLTPAEGQMPYPQVAAVTQPVALGPQSSVQPTAQAASQLSAQPTSYVESAVPLPASPRLQRSASSDNGEPPVGGTTVSAGNTYRF